MTKTFITVMMISCVMFLSHAHAGKSASALLQITLDISDTNRAAAVEIYQKYRQPFLDQIKGAKAKDLLVRDQDVQVLHTFNSVAEAEAYLSSDLFAQDVVGGLKPLLNGAPEIRIYAKF